MMQGMPSIAKATQKISDLLEAESFRPGQSRVSLVLRPTYRSYCNVFARLTCCGLPSTSGNMGGVISTIELTLMYSMKSGMICLVNQWSEPQCPRPCHARLADRRCKVDSIRSQHEVNRAKQGSARRLSRGIVHVYKTSLMQNLHPASLSHLIMSSQQSNPSYPAIPASVAKTLAQSGVQLTPELALEISRAMANGSGDASVEDNGATTATAGRTSTTMITGANGEAGASEHAMRSDPGWREEVEVEMMVVEREGEIDSRRVPELRDLTESPAAIHSKLIAGVRHWLAIPR